MPTFNGESGAKWSYDNSQPLGDEGGFGRVYRGYDSNDTPVAIKRVPLRWGDDAERRRREREVEIGAILQLTPSSHILANIDIAREGDVLLIVMPIAQRSLAAALTNGIMSDRDRLDAVRQILQGLVELAAVSIIHRDLKPADVLLVDGHWKLADFGISRSIGQPTATYTFLGAGTLPYMAPELWEGQPATVKTDLYASGVVAYEVLTGRRPFLGADELHLREQHLYDQPSIPPDLEPAISRLLLRLLAKRSVDRPQDARAALEDFDRATQRLSLRQEALRRAALQAESIKLASSAKLAADAASDSKDKERHNQALSDLTAIWDDAVELAKESLPEVTAGAFGPRWYLAWKHARVTMQIWPTPSEPLHADPIIVLLGELADNRASTRLYGNIVCVLQDDRLKWYLWRFVVEGVADLVGFTVGSLTRYLTGVKPLYEVEIAIDRHVDPLTPETILDLFELTIYATS